ncbi:HNH endonuclease [Mycolicibacterium sp. 3033]|nr:HNH endonuclease [Mycolicibacterium aurantiacum]
MFERFVSGAVTPGERVRAYARVENAACAARLSAMADLLERAYAASGSAEREQWCCDNWSSVCAQIGAAQTLTSGMVNALLTNAVTLRDRLPEVAAVFAEGLITYLLVRAICQRTALVQDPAALRAIDAELAEQLRTWGAKSLSQTDADIDTLVLRHDPYAVRRAEEVVRTTGVTVHTDGATGVAHVDATVTATDGAAFDRRADLLARTVCDRDPRTLDQRRAAALGAMGFGWDRLPCMCEEPDCDATARPPVGGVVIHVIAREDAVGEDGNRASDDATHEANPETDPPPQPRTGDLTAQRRALAGRQPDLLSRPLREYTLPQLTSELNEDAGEFSPASPGIVIGGPVLPAAVVAQLALHATTKKLIHPGKAPPEPRYRPSKALADFVRARDLTCRQPGCTRPIDDLDHTIPYPWGPTCASNLAGYCRHHHLLKTFWAGWSSVQHSDGTIVFTDPDGQTSTSYPGSRLLFTELSEPTAAALERRTPPPKRGAGPHAGLAMPKRRITRKEARRQRINAERQRNASWAQQHLRESTPGF